MNRRKFVKVTGMFSLISSVEGLPGFVTKASATPKIEEKEQLSYASWIEMYQSLPVEALLTDPRAAKLFDTLVNSQGENGHSVHEEFVSFSAVPEICRYERSRYFIASGSMSQCAFNRALLWVDTYPCSGKPKILLALVSVAGSDRILRLIADVDLIATNQNVPRHFRQTIRKWFRSTASAKRWDGGRLNRLEIAGCANTRNVCRPTDVGLHPARFSLS